jgi:hypothetical protein
MNPKNPIAAGAAAATAIATLLLAAASAAHAAKDTAQAEAKEPTRQQSKMATCNKEAGEKTLKGDERKKFMSECLSAKKAAK